MIKKKNQNEKEHVFFISEKKPVCISSALLIYKSFYSNTDIKLLKAVGVNFAVQL